jgi:2-dehydro-3-deoxyphosphogluconate aldolase/(4S)-4-hydroxy-2-oxoglutarate aldolase
MQMQNGILALLQPYSVVPVAVLHTEEQADSACRRLLEQGYASIEITLRTQGALDLIRYVKTQYGAQLCVGAGTVCQPAQAEAAAKAGAEFLVSPGQTEALVLAMKNTGLPYLPGAVSPSEIMQSQERDLGVLKFFPAHLFGGAAALSAYASVFQSVRFVPTGGIGQATKQDYLSLPNVVAVGGSWMLK